MAGERRRSDACLCKRHPSSREWNPACPVHRLPGAYPAEDRRQSGDPMPQMSGAFERPDGSVVRWFGNPEVVAWRERHGIPPLDLSEDDFPVRSHACPDCERTHPWRECPEEMP